MLISETEFLQTSLYPNTNWLNDDKYFLIDETTKIGQRLAEIVIENFPYIELVIKDDKLVDIIPNEELKIEQDLLESLVPTPEEVFRAEIDLQIINILQEADLI